MFPSVARSASGERADARAEVLDELPDHADLAQDLGHREHEVGRRRALAQRAGQPEADDLRHEHRQRLAEHRRLGLDAADAPAEHAEAVDHRRVRVGADERVGEGDAVAHLDDAREVLEVDLVDDAGVRRHDAEVVERALAPAEERVALAVALELELDVALDREPRRELVDLHRVVDHELDRDQRVDRARVAALVAHRVAHRGEVDDARDAREVLQQDARRARTRSRATARRRRPSRRPPRRRPRSRCGGRSRAGSGACTGAGRRRRRACGTRSSRRRPVAAPCLDLRGGAISSRAANSANSSWLSPIWCT